MIGNDIVDLSASKLNSRWEEQRFLDKLFTSEEQEFILKDTLRLQNIWHLWSMKESVYKIISKSRNIQKFNPKDFHCQMASLHDNSVRFDNTYFVTNTVANEQFIYTTAFGKSENFYTSWIRFQNNEIGSQTHEIKQLSIKKFSDLKRISKDSVSIYNDNYGIPRIYIKGKIQDNHISITHHGRYGGFAIAI